MTNRANQVENNVEILVCARRVPDTSENEIQLNGAGNDIERDDLVYSVNEADNYAVEEALQLVAKAGGNVTVATVGDEEDEEILRREMAMGANKGVLISDETFHGSDGRGIATVLKGYVQKNKFDLILTGVQAEDGAAQVGGMLAAMLDYPFASLVNGIEVVDGDQTEDQPRDRRRQQGDQRDRSALRAVDSDRHQRAALCRHARHPAGGVGGDSHLWRSRARVSSRRRRGCRCEGEARGLFCSRAGKGAEILKAAGKISPTKWWSC